MKHPLKSVGLGIALIGASLFANAAEASQKIGYVSTSVVLSQMAQASKVNEKLRAEFKDRIAEIERIEKKLKEGVEKLKRDGELMSETQRTNLQRELQSSDADLKLKVSNLREDERKRSAEEQRKLIERLQKAIDNLAKKEGYDLILDKQVALYISDDKNDLSEKLLKNLK